MASGGKMKYRGPKGLSLLPSVNQTRNVTQIIFRKKTIGIAIDQGSMGTRSSSSNGLYNLANSSDSTKQPTVSRKNMSTTQANLLTFMNFPDDNFLYEGAALSLRYKMKAPIPRIMERKNCAISAAPIMFTGLIGFKGLVKIDIPSPWSALNNIPPHPDVDCDNISDGSSYYSCPLIRITKNSPGDPLQRRPPFAY